MISFTAADVERFLAEDNGEPVVMLNLLRYRPDGGRGALLRHLRYSMICSSTPALRIIASTLREVSQPGLW
jgi:hypothetical protein